MLSSSSYSSSALIRVLPLHTIQLIAAGEVIERPASALKELLENAIDAGATAIKVRIGGGGLHLLSVEDNGAGIAEASLPFLFQKHATSKMTAFEDLEKLGSFGFRGEALHSLGVIGAVNVWTATRDSRRGYRVSMNHGSVSEVEVAEWREGTLVSVGGLFAQTPARRKFLKSERSEKRALLEIARKMAAFFHEVDWNVEDAEDGLSWARRRESKAERLAWAFDSESAQDWAPVQIEASWGRAEIDYVKPSKVGSSKAGILIFVNQRLVRESSLEFAMKKGFESFTDRPRELSAMVRLTLDPQSVDPNIHPRKLEVALIARDEIVSALIRTLREHLSEDHHRALKNATQGERDEERDDVISPTAPGGGGGPFLMNLPPLYPAELNVVSSPSPSPSPSSSPSLPPSSPSSPPTLLPLASMNLLTDSFEVLGAIDQTFLVVKRDDELLLFDQHALHERILYEDFMKEMATYQKLPSQRKLFPEPLKVEGLDVLAENEELLSSLGYEVRSWGAGGFQLVAAPAHVRGGHADILRTLAQSQELPREVLLKNMMETLACHSAIRAHDSVQPEMVRRLVRQFLALPNLGYCPHGRPTFVRLSVLDLEKLFHRSR